jgi:hypothetical protein
MPRTISSNPFPPFDTSGYLAAMRYNAMAGQAIGQGYANVGQGVGALGQIVGQKKERSKERQFQASERSKDRALRQQELSARSALEQQQMYRVDRRASLDHLRLRLNSLAAEAQQAEKSGDQEGWIDAQARMETVRNSLKSVEGQLMQQGPAATMDGASMAPPSPSILSAGAGGVDCSGGT